MIYIQGFLMFIFSLSNDWFAIKWHAAREKGEPIRGAYIAFVMGAIGWISFIWVLNTSFWLAVPDLIGNVVGSYYGIKHFNAPLPIAIALGFASKPETDE